MPCEAGAEREVLVLVVIFVEVVVDVVFASRMRSEWGLLWWVNRGTQLYTLHMFRKDNLQALCP